VHSRRLEQWAGLAGIAYVVLFIVGALLALGDQPDTSESQSAVREYYADSGNRDKIGVGWALITLGLFFFLWFLSALREALRRLDADRFLTTLVTIGGGVYAALALTSVALNTAIKTMSDDTFRHQVYPELIHAADDAGYVLHSSGGVGAAAMMIGASLAALRAAAVPAWAGWLGVVFGILAIFSIAFFPQALIALWILVVSALLFRFAGRSETARAA